VFNWEQNQVAYRGQAQKNCINFSSTDMTYKRKCN